MRTMDWPELIGLLILVKERLYRLDEDAPYGYRAPHSGATENEIQALESALGGSLDASHRELLAHINGWPDLLISNELLSTQQLSDDNLRAQVLEYSSLDGHEYSETDWLPLARAVHDRDTMLIGRPGTTHAGRVVWLADGVIDTYDSVRDWFLAMIEYHKRALARFGVVDVLAP